MFIFDANHNCATIPRHRYRCRAASLCVLFACLLILLTGCEGLSSEPSVRSPDSGSVHESINQTVSGETGNTATFTLDPLLPPGGEVRPAKTGETGRSRTAEGLPIMEGKGISADTLFVEPLKDANARMARLENAVVEVRRDLDAAMPAITHLVAIEGDIQELLIQLRTLLNEQGRVGSSQSAPTIAPPDAPTPDSLMTEPQVDISSIKPLRAEELDLAPTDARIFDADHPVEKPAAPINAVIQNTISAPSHAPTPPLAKKEVPAAAVVTSSISSLTKTITVDNIRIGDHADKIRLVIDSPDPIKITTDLDRNEKILIIEITGADVTPGVQKPSLPIIKSIALKSTGSRAGQLILELNHVTTVESSQIPPSGSNPHTRVVIDLSK